MKKRKKYPGEKFPMTRPIAQIREERKNEELFREAIKESDSGKLPVYNSANELLKALRGQ